jgi:hypothetical protein
MTTETCTCLSISRDPLCVFHGDAHTLKLLRARETFVAQWCEAHGKTFDTLTVDEIFKIRQDPRWKDPLAHKE